MYVEEGRYVYPHMTWKEHMLAFNLPGLELSYYREVLTTGWELAKKKSKTFLCQWR